MTFYFLLFAVALTSIFGIVHSQTAREKLHLQTIYEWSVEAVQQQLRNYNERSIDLENHEIVEITVQSDHQQQTTSPPSVPSSGSVESIQGIRIGQQDDVEQMPESIASALKELRNETNDQDKVLAAINASLRRLSKAAVSGRINGTQLYEILLQETRLHENKAAETPAGGNNAADAAAGASSSTSSPGAPEVTELSNDTNAEDGPKMYFGDKPLEYVPHHAN